MSAVQIERGPQGFAVLRYFRNLPAAIRAAELMFSVSEVAFEPVAKPEITQEEVRLQVALNRAESDDLAPHDGRHNPPSDDAE